MLDKFLSEVVVAIVGKPGEKMAELLNSKKHVNEFIIAKKMDITINQARNFLYKLSDFGVVSSIRKKDKKKGWYTYFWKIEILKALEFLKQSLIEKKQQINELTESRETNQYYVCERCNLEFNEEVALLMNFTCDECGGIFTSKDNSKLIKEFKKRVEVIDQEILLIDKEIAVENQKLDKEKEKELKKLEKENEAKKAEKKLIRQKALAKKKADAIKDGKVPVKKIAKSTKKVVSKKVVKKTAAKK